MKQFICLLLIATCALAVPVDQQTTTEPSKVSTYAEKNQPKPTAARTQQHPAQFTRQAAEEASSNKQTSNKPQTTVHLTKQTTDTNSNGHQNVKSLNKRDTQNVQQVPAVHPALSNSENLSEHTESNTNDHQTNAQQAATKTSHKRETQNVPVQPASAVHPAATVAVNKGVTKAPVSKNGATKARREAPKPAATSTVLKTNQNQPIPTKPTTAQISNQPAKLTPVAKPSSSA